MSRDQATVHTLLCSHKIPSLCSQDSHIHKVPGIYSARIEKTRSFPRISHLWVFCLRSLHCTDFGRVGIFVYFINLHACTTSCQATLIVNGKCRFIFAIASLSHCISNRATNMQCPPFADLKMVVSPRWSGNHSKWHILPHWSGCLVGNEEKDMCSVRLRSLLWI